MLPNLSQLCLRVRRPGEVATDDEDDEENKKLKEFKQLQGQFRDLHRADDFHDSDVTDEADDVTDEDDDDTGCYSDCSCRVRNDDEDDDDEEDEDEEVATVDDIIYVMKQEDKQRATKNAERRRKNLAVAAARKKIIASKNIHLKFVKQVAEAGFTCMRRTARTLAFTAANTIRTADSSFEARDVFVGTIIKHPSTVRSSARFMLEFLQPSDLVLAATVKTNKRRSRVRRSKGKLSTSSVVSRDNKKTCKPISPGGPCL
jgi:hypothetical protein